MDIKTFASSEEEARHWKTLYLKSVSEYEELKKEFNEYEEQSKTLEAELDMLCKEEEQKNKDLNATVSRLKNEVEVLKERLETQSRNEAAQHNELSTDLHAFKKECHDLNERVRELEQKNDDFERTNRVLDESIRDFEAKLSLALEKNVLLESELDEKENLNAIIQRMRDETRDLRNEMAAQRLQQDSNRTSTPNTPTATAQKPVIKEVVANSRPARLSPLSIVNDLLRKVGALETKLSTYKRVEPAKRQKRDMIKT